MSEGRVLHAVRAVGVVKAVQAMLRASAAQLREFSDAERARAAAAAGRLVDELEPVAELHRRALDAVVRLAAFASSHVAHLDACTGDCATHASEQAALAGALLADVRALQADVVEGRVPEEALVDVLDKMRVLEAAEADFRAAAEALHATAVDGLRCIMEDVTELFLAVQHVSSDEVACMLDEACPVEPKLRMLNLCGNDVDDAGARAIATFAERHACLETVDLSQNELGDAGARDMARALALSEGLRRVAINGNHVSDECLAELRAPAGRELVAQ